MNARKTAETTGTKRTALINARLLDPASGRDEAGGLLIEAGVIADLGPHLRRSAPRDAAVVNCEDRLVIPGLVDMQVFTGEPGLEHRETLASASRAAAAGGVTTMIVMPSTDPVIDDMALVDFVNRRGRDTAVVNVHTMAALTKGLIGKEMSELGLLKMAGAVAFSNGRRSVASAKVMRRALTYAKDFDALVVHHTEDDDLADVGVVNEGEISARLGLPGIPKAAEIVMVERDIRLAELSGGRYHAATISCRESLDAIRAAKKRKLRVSCGVSINHLTLNENDIGSYRTFHKMRPPLRSEDDRRAMVEGIADGSIDVIVSAHDPQGTDGKRRPFADAAEGAVGIETLLPAALQLVHAGDVTLKDLFAALTCRPAALLGLPAGKIEKGAPADLTIVDLGTPWMLDRDVLRSKAKNSPFDEAKFQGRVVRTLVAGETVFPFGG